MCKTCVSYTLQWSISNDFEELKQWEIKCNYIVNFYLNLALTQQWIFLHWLLAQRSHKHIKPVVRSTNIYIYIYFSLTHMLYKILLLPFINISDQKWFINFSKNYLVFKRCFVCLWFRAKWKRPSYIYLYRYFVLLF